MANHTEKQCLEMIGLYREAEIKVLSGQRYRIGTRELERADLAEIQKGRAYWENELLKVRGKRRRGARRVIPRDL
ncbi:hypothetical protein IX317_000628 [Fusobacterium sp. DD29]|uniref:DUF6148 family protein n=1 Tax=unclassified Fusobacterium TaxID=2648384 RepID=UPI001DC5852B|nr:MULTISPECIES: DUF6148 family protein [unclassified Fusobacterium]MBR8700250.1 hypothetical protein [Fusobacterium sp. DD45]MBR8710495.1 hypothetical protein [Fusobacterium sp. DD28]MBR8748967.1 hypothetical protein [Fusobacterium sp. DD29]MBR8751055.1 hypothetical protein [Fusobacterium sp. DD26]MBR8761273.1 hypothetical protein [Fusobacterium sp. DD25]